MGRPDIEAIRTGLEATQERIRGYSPVDIAAASDLNPVGRFDRIVAETYAFKTLPALLAYVAELEAVARAVAESDPETSYDHELTTACAWCEVSQVWPDDGGESYIPHADNCVWKCARQLLTNQASRTAAEE